MERGPGGIRVADRDPEVGRRFDLELSDIGIEPAAELVAGGERDLGATRGPEPGR